MEHGSIWTVVAVGVGVAFAPLILGDAIDGTDATGDSIASILGPLWELLGIVFVLAVLVLLWTYFDTSF